MVARSWSNWYSDWAVSNMSSKYTTMRTPTCLKNLIAGFVSFVKVKGAVESPNGRV